MVIYFVRSRKTGHIQIAYLEGLKERLWGLKQVHGDIELLGIAQGAYRKEAALHTLFDRYRVKGRPSQWFHASHEVLEYIAQNTSLEDVPRPLHPRRARKGLKPDRTFVLAEVGFEALQEIAEIEGRLLVDVIREALTEYTTRKGYSIRVGVERGYERPKSNQNAID